VTGVAHLNRRSFLVLAMAASLAAIGAGVAFRDYNGLIPGGVLAAVTQAFAIRFDPG